MFDQFHSSLLEEIISSKSSTMGNTIPPVMIALKCRTLGATMFQDIHGLGKYYNAHAPFPQKVVDGTYGFQRR